MKSRNSTVEYTLNKLEPGGKYHVTVQLGNMSKESSVKITAGERRGGAEACCPCRVQGTRSAALEIAGVGTLPAGSILGRGPCLAAFRVL